MKQVFILSTPIARGNAVQAVKTAPDGYRVEIKPKGRSLDSNALLWVILGAFSKQLKWAVNGQMTQMEAEDWKVILTAAFRQESSRMAQGLNGGFVFLGMRTSKMDKQEFSEFLEFVQATAALRGVNL